MSRRLRLSTFRNKFGNVRTKCDGYVFDSKAEANRYRELRMLEKAGEIRAFVVHPKFPLRARPNDGSQLLDVVIGDYVADFSYVTIRDDQRHVEDVKGVRTALYRWKKKHVEIQYGIRIEEIAAC